MAEHPDTPKPWSMPEWMEKYRELILRTHTDSWSLEGLMSQHPLDHADETVVYAAYCVVSRIRFLEQLREAGYVEAPVPAASVPEEPAPAQLELRMRASREAKQVFLYKGGKWEWRNRDKPKDVHGPFDTFWEALVDSTEPYLEIKGT